MKRLAFLSFAIVAFILMDSCSTKFNVAAPYKNITVIYGFLDQADGDGGETGLFAQERGQRLCPAGGGEALGELVGLQVGAEVEVDRRGAVGFDLVSEFRGGA